MIEPADRELGEPREVERNDEQIEDDDDEEWEDE